MRTLTTFSFCFVCLLALAAPAQAEGRRQLEPVERRGGLSPVDRSGAQYNMNSVQGYIPGDPAPQPGADQDMDGVFYTMGDDGSYRTHERPSGRANRGRVPFEP